MDAGIIQSLKDVVGAPGWLAPGEDAQFTRDLRGAYGGPAALVVRPATTAEVAAVVGIAARAGLVVVAQGGNTSLVGGSVPRGDRPAIVLSLSRMNRVLSVDPARYSVTAEAGCTLQQIHDAAEAVDRQFAMDWGARGTATIGGGISTNAGGLNVLRYGTTREQVLGLEVVLPDGRVWDGARALRKDTAGYDLKQMFIGAEGSLGIVTRAVLKLHPRPTESHSMLAAISGLDRLMPLFVMARSIAGHELSAFELLPGLGIERVPEVFPAITRPIATKAPWFVLVRVSGGPGVVERLFELFERASEADLIRDGVLSQSLAQEQNLWALRDELPPGRLLKGRKVKWDSAVPLDRVVPFLAAFEAATAEIDPRLATYTFGHVGDGNLHLTVWHRETMAEAEFAAMEPRILADIDRLVWQFEGTICAEHGVGVENATRVLGQKSPVELELMGRLRAMLDPAGLMNPGKGIAG